MEFKGLTKPSVNPANPEKLHNLNPTEETVTGLLNCISADFVSNEFVIISMKYN